MSVHRTSYSSKQRTAQLDKTEQHIDSGQYKEVHTGEIRTKDQVDLGHKKGFEERHLQTIANKLGFTQREYNDLCRNSENYTKGCCFYEKVDTGKNHGQKERTVTAQENGRTMYQAEDKGINRSGRKEENDPLVSRHNGYIMCRNYRAAQAEGKTNVRRNDMNKIDEQKQKKMQEKAEEQKKRELERKQKLPLAEKEKSQKVQKETGKSTAKASGKTAGKATAKAAGNRGGGKSPAGGHGGNAGGGHGGGAGGGHGGGAGGGHGGSAGGDHGGSAGGGHGGGAGGGHGGGAGGGHGGSAGGGHGGSAGGH